MQPPSEQDNVLSFYFFKQRLENLEEIAKENSKRITKLESFKIVAETQIALINKTLDDIKDDTKWIRRTFTTIISTGTFGGIVSFVIWLIQR